jgi:ABC-type branched-subunit amino acid transport system substrate-binding protein
MVHAFRFRANPVRERLTKIYRPSHSALAISAIFCAFFVGSAQAESAPPWLIGVVCPLTTQSKSFGIPHLQGITLAIDQEQLNSDIRIEIRVTDDESDPDRGDLAMRQLMNEQALAILGPCNTRVAERAISDTYLRLPIISSLATATSLTSEPHQFFFRANVSDEQRIDELLSQVFATNSKALDLQPSEIVALYDQGDPYGEGLLSDVQNWLQANEAKFIADGNFVPAGYHEDLKQKDADLTVENYAEHASSGGRRVAWLLLGLTSDARYLIKAIRTQGLDVDIYLIGPEPEAIMPLAIEHIPLAGIRFVSVWDERDARMGDTIRSFRTGFINKFGEQPTYGAALGFDATQVLLSALKATLKSHPAEGVEKLRVDLNDELNQLKPDRKLFVLDGDHSFLKGQYADLSFQGYQLDDLGETEDWYAHLESTAVPRQDIVGINLPRYPFFLIAGFCGFLGSALRTLYRESSVRPIAAFRELFRPVPLVADPVIALVVFAFIFVAGQIIGGGYCATATRFRRMDTRHLRWTYWFFRRLLRNTCYLCCFSSAWRSRRIRQHAALGMNML